MTKPKWTRKCLRFIDLYTTVPKNPSESEKHYLNGAKSAREAGYSSKNANRIATRLLSNVHIKAEIDRRLEEQRKELAINRDNIVKRLWEIVNEPDAKHTDKINAALGTAKVLGITKDTEISINLQQLFRELRKERVDIPQDMVENNVDET